MGPVAAVPLLHASERGSSLVQSCEWTKIMIKEPPLPLVIESGTVGRHAMALSDFGPIRAK